MTPHPQPHKLFCAAQIRCEQCGYFNPYTCDDDSEGECWRFPHHENIDRPKAHSCAEGKLFWDDRASHSSAQSEQEIREKVLKDEMEGILNWGDRFGENAIPGYIRARVLHIERERKELRSKQGKQK